MSAELTERSPVVSPMRQPTRAATSLVLTPSLTPSKVTVTYWALFTPARFTVTVVLLLPLTLETLGVPDANDVICALLKVTGNGKVNTICVGPPLRHSTPGVPPSGRLIS